jgi:FkbM family methyltransferase
MNFFHNQAGQRHDLTAISDQPIKPITTSDLPPPLTAGPYEKVAADVGSIWLSTADHVMRDHIRTTGTWEPEEGRLLRRLLQPDSRFLDVGANIGYFSLFASKAHSGITIDAVEPFPATIPILHMNLWLNRVQANLWPVALDTGRNALTIAAALNNVGDARVGDVDPFKRNLAELVIPSLAGDTIFPGRSFDVVKLDVQGWELEVLTGLAGVLAASPGIQIVAEFWPGALRERGVDPLDRLTRYRQMGFDVRVSRGDDLERLSDREIVARCDGAGPNGQLNLVLS